MQQKCLQVSGLGIVEAIKGLGVKADVLMEGHIKPPSKCAHCNDTLHNIRLSLKVAQDHKLVDTDMLMDAADIFCNNKVAVGFLVYEMPELCACYLIWEWERMQAKATHNMAGHTLFELAMGVHVSHGTIDTIGTPHNGHGQDGFGQFAGKFTI
ncbi:hypothetical protein M427DRAFT_44572 [Gonapodya prolifera JEL478]|uniref:Uncharacterized protein n=1 Tax=Gonapodya prolifera (strain JEL478) TaxID=1344416 RepID=A0A139AFS8_GONPJ|nr:hypothetical protein M427DRAFT_44572 [Gonapodya prolifera JEL478]|eukprot:KXS15275.1 hypothetical protein M427DRAFT_44572 [Gonapodya prolifera JEL478]